MVEIGFQMGVLGRTKIVIPHADKNKYLQQPGDKSWASVLNASGNVVPPFLIIEGEHHQLHCYPQNRQEG